MLLPIVLRPSHDCELKAWPIMIKQLHHAQFIDSTPPPCTLREALSATFREAGNCPLGPLRVSEIGNLPDSLCSDPAFM